MSKQILSLFFIVTLASCLLLGCTGQTVSSAASSTSSPALFEIVRQDGSRFPVTAEVIASLPAASETIEGKSQDGPRVSDLLKAAGVDSYTQLIFSGTGTYTVTADQVNEHFLLDLSNRGTYKMASPDIPKVDWVKDITQIEVK